MDRNTRTWEEALYHLKTTLRFHGRAIVSRYELLLGITTVDTSTNRNQGIFFTVAILIFMVPVYLVSRRG